MLYLNVLYLSKYFYLFFFISILSNDCFTPQTGRTEKVKNNLNPVFGTGVDIPYIFEKQTFCKVVVIDDDSAGMANEADNLGEAEFTLGQVSNTCLPFKEL